MTARYYSANTGNMPSVKSKILGDIIIGFKAALVTGYNQKPAAGWQMLYESAANDADNSYRIAVRSQSTASEQKVFEIIDISSTEAAINCWENWQDNKGISLLVSAKINKNCWADDMFVIADETFVHFTVSAVYHAFGDAAPFDTSKQKTMIYAMDNTTGHDYEHVIASTRHQNRIKFKDTVGNTYICRSFANEQLGFGSRVSWENAPVYDHYMGGDRNNFESGKITSIRRTELLKPVNDWYEEYGYLPLSVYTDNPRTMMNKRVTVDGVDKDLAVLFCDGMAALLFLVDV